MSLLCIPDRSFSNLNRMEGSCSGILVLEVVSKRKLLQLLSTQASGTHLSMAAVALIIHLIEKFSTLRAVAWHPTQHVVALAGMGTDAAVLLYCAEKTKGKCYPEVNVKPM